MFLFINLAGCLIWFETICKYLNLDYASAKLN